MWFSAINELLMFFFGMASCGAGEAPPMAPGPPGGKNSRAWRCSRSPCFPRSRPSSCCRSSCWWWSPRSGAHRLPRLAPHLVLVLLCLASMAQSRSNSFRFTDGSFSLHAPFWLTWPHSFARLLWIWGWPAAARPLRSSAMHDSGEPRWPALAWIGIALVPYSFLTYSTQIPSRQVYLASAGLALLVGLALARYEGRRLRRRAVRRNAAAQHRCTCGPRSARSSWSARRPRTSLIDFARQHPGRHLGAVLPAAAESSPRKRCASPPGARRPIWYGPPMRHEIAQRLHFATRGNAERPDFAYLRMLREGGSSRRTLRISIAANAPAMSRIASAQAISGFSRRNSTIRATVSAA